MKFCWHILKDHRAWLVISSFKEADIFIDFFVLISLCHECFFPLESVHLCEKKNGC